MRFGSTCPERRRVPRVVLLSLLTMVAIANSRAQSAQGPQIPPDAGHPSFSAVTDMVVLQVSVVDGKHRFVADLNAADFSVYEEGERQQVSAFVSSRIPLDVMVVLDTSISMVRKLPLVQRAATTFVHTLKSEDRAAIVLFNDSVRIAQPLTRDTDSLESAIENARARGSTALYEAIYVAQHELERTRPKNDPRRQAIVLLSDGDDTRSRIAFDDVLEQARRSPVTIYTVTPSPVSDPVTRIPWQQGTLFDMRQIAEVTGGRSFAPVKIDDLPPIYSEIASELGQQYWLGYVPLSEKEGFRRVSVRVDGQGRSGIRARTRSGYYAGGSSGGQPSASAPHP